MPPESPQLPPKPEVALALLQTASSVYIHLDPRDESVSVPSWFKKQPQLVLQVGLNMAVPIPDLDVGQEAISCTLSFNRRPEFCRIPWDAIYGLVGEDGRGMIWPESVPAEVASAADGRPPVAAAAKPKAKLRLASSEGVSQEDSGKVSSPSASAPPSLTSVSRAAPTEAPEADAEVAQSGGGALSGDSAAPPPAYVADQASDQGKRRELPPYLRVVK